MSNSNGMLVQDVPKKPRSTATSATKAFQSDISGLHTAMDAKYQREWDRPEGDCSSGLHLYNSLVDEKVPFVPSGGPQSRQVTWYACGPTVYDSAHMGHARNYVSFDIVRRVMEDYFGFNILSVMNVTDVDDKIILRARRNHLLKSYKQNTKEAKQVYYFSVSAADSAERKQSGKCQQLAEQVAQLGSATSSTEKKKLEELQSALKNEEHKLSQITRVKEQLKELGPGSPVEDILAVAGEAVAEQLDKELGSQVTDHALYRAHAAKYEAEFFEDLVALGCRLPDVLTRVSEYVPEIVSYVDQILKNGMAYVSAGSVYFDTQAYREAGHTYGKLKPWAVGSASLAAEGESNFETSEKRHPADFALWKASKPGEPFWDSPWSPGRPGWHIECSAMACCICGSRLDIHSGGEDLKFPHHDNEIAQAEAHYHHEGCRQWVNYFLHAGHLNIEGLKMSKSLKNFITIREALQSFSSRQLRLMFVLQPWNKPMVYGESSLTEMKAKEALVKNFFQNVAAAVREGSQDPLARTKWEGDEAVLHAQIQESQQQVHACLCDNINTAAAMDVLCNLIRHVNIYLAKKQQGAAHNVADGSAGQGQSNGVGHCSPVQPLLLRKSASFVTYILSTFGLISGPRDALGWAEVGEGTAGLDAVAKYLDAFSTFRDEVRSIARSKGDRDILKSCDQVRDETLVALGVRLEDRPDGKAVWKLDDPEVMRAEQEERARAQAEAQKKKLMGVLDKKVKEKEKFEKLLELPSIADSLSEKYSKFDPETGEPTHDKEGAALEGKAKDKARKELEKLKKVREPLVKKTEEDPDFLMKIKEEIEQLSQQLAALNAT